MGDIPTAIALANIKSLSLTTCGSIYKAYIRPVFLYESECSAPVVSVILKLQRNDRAMHR